MTGDNPFLTLVHAHDIIWKDKSWDWRVRFAATSILWRLAIEVSREKFLGKTKERQKDAVEAYEEMEAGRKLEPIIDWEDIPF